MVREISIDDVMELEFECTTLCNAQCPLCYRNYVSFQKSPYGIPTVRDFQETLGQLDTFRNLRYVMLVGSMSEPTLYPNFLDLVEYLKRRGVKIEICTNGDTRDENFWRRLGRVLDENDSVYFTICGATQELHEKYRVGTNLSNIVRNASYIRQEKPIDYAQCIRFNYNSGHFDSLQFKRFISQFSNVYMTETFYPKQLSNYQTKFNVSDFTPCREKLHLYDRMKSFAKKQYLSGKSNPSECMCKRYGRFQLDVYGNLYPCYLFLEYSNGTAWNMDRDDIIHVNHECCMFCDKVA